MKKILMVSLVVLGLIAGCSKESEDVLYSKSAPEYTFFKSLSDSIPVLKPDEKVTLIALDCGNITNYDVMPELYRAVNGQLDITEVPSEHIVNYINQVAISLADKNMLMADAADQGIEVSEEDIQAEMEQIWSNPRFGGSEEAFKDYIESQGFTMDMVRQDIRDGLIFQAYLEQVIDPEIDVPEEVLQEAYKAPVSASVRHILLSTQGQNPEEKAETRKKMEGILKRARSGEDFAKLAKEYSEDPGSKEQGGLYENFSRGQMVPAFDEAAFSEPVGSITDIVETQFGYHIIKILDRKSETRPFEEVRDSLRANELSSLRNAAIEAKLEELKEKYNYSKKF
ncbi:MAG: peptidyl-prolyl cis-trans isomerase [Candidatus Marinimicrobia bacterium]|jgi:parvulin-like peptidyl-prolyl isomerase|nr:peptidyl-prolyl cis-trans isomerase [Candidatus Neomarinimicrobiota bacterium]